MQLSALAPDKFHRYNHALQAVSAVSPAGKQLRILDLGACEGLLQRFLPEHFVVQMDINPNLDSEKIVCGDARFIPFPDNSFDIVVSLDLLEHVESGFRKEIVREAARVSNSAIIFAFPCKSEQNLSAESDLNQIEKTIRGKPSCFLEEHAEFGLVDVESIAREFEAVFPHTRIIPGLDFRTWFLSSILGAVLSVIPNSQNFIREFNALFNLTCRSDPGSGAVYRMMIIGSGNHIPVNLPESSAFDMPEKFRFHPVIREIYSALKDQDSYALNLQELLRTKEEYLLQLERSFKRMEQQAAQQAADSAAEFTSLKKQYENLERAYRKLTEDNTELSSEYGVLEAAYLKLQEQNAALKSEIGQLVESIKTSGRKLRKVETQYAALEKSYTALQNELQENKACYAELEAGYRNVLRENENISRGNKELRQLAADLRKSIDHLESEYKNLESDYTNLESNYFGLNHLSSGLERDLSELRQYVFHLNRELRMKEAEYAKLENFARNFTEQFKSSEKLINEQERRIAELEAHLIKYQESGSAASVSRDISAP